MNTNLLNNIAFDIVKDKVIEDKVKEYTEEQQREAEEKYKQAKKDEENAEEFPDIEESDSEEERIMQRELMKRKEHIDKVIEKENKKKLMKYGTYKDIIETEFLDTMLKNENVICHFYHNDFERCKIMDKHLKIIAETHPDTLFVRINAEKTPFFTTKLQIKVLPSVILFKDGKAFDRIVGFEDLGMKDDFATITLTRRLVKAKIVKANNKAERGEVTINKKSGKNYDEEDDDLDY